MTPSPKWVFQNVLDGNRQAAMILSLIMMKTYIQYTICRPPGSRQLFSQLFSSLTGLPHLLSGTIHLGSYISAGPGLYTSRRLVRLTHHRELTSGRLYISSSREGCTSTLACPVWRTPGRLALLSGLYIWRVIYQFGLLGMLYHRVMHPAAWLSLFYLMSCYGNIEWKMCSRDLSLSSKLPDLNRSIKLPRVAFCVSFSYRVEIKAAAPKNWPARAFIPESNPSLDRDSSTGPCQDPSRGHGGTQLAVAWYAWKWVPELCTFSREFFEGNRAHCST